MQHLQYLSYPFQAPSTLHHRHNLEKDPLHPPSAGLERKFYPGCPGSATVSAGLECFGRLGSLESHDVTMFFRGPTPIEIWRRIRSQSPQVLMLTFAVEGSSPSTRFLFPPFSLIWWVKHRRFASDLVVLCCSFFSISLSAGVPRSTHRGMDAEWAPDSSSGLAILQLATWEEVHIWDLQDRPSTFGNTQHDAWRSSREAVVVNSCVACVVVVGCCESPSNPPRHTSQASYSMG